MIPTRDEVAAAPALVEELLASSLAPAVWVMDDASTDGTVERIEALAAREPRVRLVRRSGPRGYGPACAEGLALALGSGAERVVQMDGDGSHSPSYLPALVAASLEADLVLGSRYLHGVSVVNWPLRRLMLSVGANQYVRAMTGLRVRDCTTGFRLWRAPLLERVALPTLRSEGYGFLVESLFRAARAGARVVEVPIVFVERRGGTSKMSGRIVVESALLPWRLLLRRLAGR